MIDWATSLNAGANMPDIVNAVCATAARTGVDLVLVDEVHNLNLATRAGSEVSDQLKYFAERLPATFAYAGIEVEAQGLFAGVQGRQIAGRFTLISATPFAYGTNEQRETWRALVASLEGMLVLHRHKPGSLVTLAEYLYQRTGGMIGSLSQLIRGAAILAIDDGSEKITRAPPAPPRPADARAPSAARPAPDGVAAADPDPARRRRDRRLLPQPAGRAARDAVNRTLDPGQSTSQRLQHPATRPRPVRYRRRPTPPQAGPRHHRTARPRTGLARTTARTPTRVQALLTRAGRCCSCSATTATSACATRSGSGHPT